DLTYDKKHIPIAKISKNAANITVTLNSCGKSFNLPGITLSYVICQNQRLRERLQSVLKTRILNETNIFVNEIYPNAYTKKGQKWLKKLVDYLQYNRDLSIRYFKKNNPKINVIKSESTYLMLLDFSNIDLTHKQIKHKLLYEAKVALNDGISFGKNGHKHFRINIALPKKQLKIALEKITNAF
ncbi:MAG: aminotransferase class I/II-fold pyridoxal phosphate-dependent enzyme, partial [Campylobacterota bacterium]|nr:aminotransferase class I/II-fold pyridoxal phosphate-dependent enzyme [Campylobacterota bacterium]